MLFSPSAFFPDGVNVDKAKLREACTLILVALGGLPGTSYSGFDDGEVVVLGDNATGPVPASVGVSAVSFRGRAAENVRTQDIVLGTSVNLTDHLHLGCWLKKTSASSCVISVEPHADPTVGVKQGFKCAIWRRAGSGAVQVVSSMSNTHLEGHTRVDSNGIATLTVDTELGEWSLHGETIL